MIAVHSLASRWSSRWHSVGAALALLIGAANLLYSMLSIAAVRWLPPVELGFDHSYLAAERVLPVNSVRKGSPAEKAGLRPGDRIVALDGRRIENVTSLHRAYKSRKPGDAIRLTVERSESAVPLMLTGVFRERPAASVEGLGSFAREVLNFFSVPFVVVGLAVLILRPRDPNVWLLTLLFASFVTAPSYPPALAVIAPGFQGFALAYRAVFLGFFGPLFYCFFAVFPRRSPLDARFGWIKWAAVALGIVFALPGLRGGAPQLPSDMLGWVGNSAGSIILLCSLYGFLTLGLVSLAFNFFGTADKEARRKIRVLFWGTVVGLAPALMVRGVADFSGFEPPASLDTAAYLALFLFPLSFAYAVVKHRVLEIPALLKRSARYLMVQRGFTAMLALASLGVTLLFASSLTRYLQPVIDVARSSGIAVGAAFGTVLLWGGLEVHKRVSGRIDRAFFRSAYDARVILEDLSEKTRTATGRGELARLLEHHLDEALHPEYLFVYLQRNGGCLMGAGGEMPGEAAALSPDTPLLAELAERGQPWEVPPGGGAPFEQAGLRPECLAPMLGRNGRLVGLLVLGPRLSEEPYSGEDKRLLASVASQAGTALDNIRLAEEMAERLEAERRVAREMEIARDVQARLLPQAPPQLKTLECAALCIQARAVGGDYFDFLDLGPRRAGFVLADVSGKGVHAALLMASLQAHLRSQSGIAPHDPVRLLTEVNRLLKKSTASQHYATLFFATYDDCARRLVYANCGHNPPLWLRRDGSLERLPATATVIGVFEQWECSVSQIELVPGDLLVVFSDGVTEAARGEEEFGEARLIEELRSASRLPVDELVTAILTSVQTFSAGTQSDDLTLLAARARA